MLKLLLTAFTFSAAYAQMYSVDFSQPATQSQFKGLKSNGYSDVVLRAYGPLLNFDTNLCHNVIDAINAGLATMIYVTPDQTKMDPEKLVTDLNEGLFHCGLTYHKWWLQVVRPDKWSTVTDDNVKFIKDVVEKAKAREQTVGIYTSEGEWKKIVGDFAINDSSVPNGFHALWYWSNSTTENFDDFKPFAGWNAPLMKQFQQGTTVQGIRVNRNIYASNFR